MARVRVPVWGTPQKCVTIDSEATQGAQLGLDLFYQGVRLRPEDILNQYAQSGPTTIYNTDGSTSPGGGGSPPPSGDLTTDDVYEGSRLYFTTTRAVNAVAGVLADTANVTLTFSAGQIKADLTTTGVAAGVYGDSSHIPQITVDNRGRIIAITLLPVSLPIDFSIMTEDGSFLTTEAGDHLVGRMFT